MRRAVAQDLERTRSAGVTDITVLTIRIDEVIRQIDDLPLLSAPLASAERRAGAVESAAVALPASAPSQRPRDAGARVTVGNAATAATAPPDGQPAAGWSDRVGQGLALVAGRVWNEVRGLVRVTRIDRPEAMLVAPDQAFFLRENVKLRLLNARLALLSRQFDAAQLDLRDAQSAIDRYFDRSARRVATASELLREVGAQARLVAVPRPDATLAAIATMSAGR